MKLRALILFVVAAVVLASCGGGGGSTVSTGGLEVLVDWPDRSRYLPTYANSVVVSIDGPTGHQQQLINRSGDLGYEGSMLFTDLSPGVYTITATAHTQTDGGGSLVAQGTRMASVESGNTTQVAVSADLESTIDHIVIAFAPEALLVGQQLQMSAHAEDVNDDLLLIPEDALTWSISAGAPHGSISAAGLLVGSAPGPLTVRVAEEGAQVEASCDVEIVPLGNKIAFSSLRTGDHEIYVMDPDGTSVVRLTFSPGDDLWPSISPDGTTIVFTSVRDGNQEVYVMDAVGANPVRLTTNSALDDQPSFSPDGTKIAFHSNRDGNWEIYSMDIDGSNQTNLTNDPSIDVSPCFNPLGTQILFVSSRAGKDLYVMNPDGSNVTQLTNDGSGESLPRYSPDGSLIVLALVTSTHVLDQVYVMNSDGTNLVRLTVTGSNEFAPTFSPDGNRIFFCSQRNGPQNNEIYSMDIGGSDLVRITNNPTDDICPSYTSD